MERDSDGVDAAMKECRFFCRSCSIADLTLQTTIRHHAKMFLFSSDLTVYRGSKSGELAKAVLVTFLLLVLLT
jgi:hypothetical protein